VIECMHELIEWQQRDEEMHCLGWMCRSCRALQVGEYHHVSWCREDFCGVAVMSETALLSRPESGLAVSATAVKARVTVY
jgi:hypothetical protein